VTRRFVLGLVGIAVGAATAVVPARAALGPSGGGCYLKGEATFDQPMTTRARAAGFTMTAALNRCQSSDRRIKSGTATGTGSGSFSCLSGDGRATAVITWNTGRRSWLLLRVRTTANYLAMEGAVVAGEFAGSPGLG